MGGTHQQEIKCATKEVITQGEFGIRRCQTKANIQYVPARFVGWLKTNLVKSAKNADRYDGNNNPCGRNALTCADDIEQKCNRQCQQICQHAVSARSQRREPSRRVGMNGSRVGGHDEVKPQKAAFDQNTQNEQNSEDSNWPKAKNGPRQMRRNRSQLRPRQHDAGQGIVAAKPYRRRLFGFYRRVSRRNALDYQIIKVMGKFFKITTNMSGRDTTP